MSKAFNDEVPDLEIESQSMKPCARLRNADTAEPAPRQLKVHGADISTRDKILVLRCRQIGGDWLKNSQDNASWGKRWVRTFPRSTKYKRRTETTTMEESLVYFEAQLAALERLFSLRIGIQGEVCEPQNLTISSGHAGQHARQCHCHQFKACLVLR